MKIKWDRQQRQQEYRKTTTITSGKIPWIEKLMATSIADYRKYCIWRILAPYLINVRKLPDDQATHTIREWLEKCNSVKRISFDETSRIRYNIQSVRRKGFYPIGWNQLKTDNVGLYNLLKIEG
jgi:hypothetical protein